MEHEPDDRDQTPLHDYHSLTPDTIIDAIESLGFHSDARVLALNSYENRVYQTGIEDEVPIIAKFYRPKRWSNAQIQEEHDFSLTLADQELSVIPPMVMSDKSLFEFAGFRFAVYKRQGGHAPALEQKDHLISIGRLLGRLHALGQDKPFTHRPELNVVSFGEDSYQMLIEGSWLPQSLLPAYTSIMDELLPLCHQHMQTISPRTIALHGDCHPGNILWRDDRAHLVDFDDARMGPAVQDLWMLLSGDENEQRQSLQDLLEGYEDFCEFNYRETLLVECLRSLRIIHYTAWLAKRWSDPSFPMNFPWFNTERYWSDHVLALREQLGAMQHVRI